MTSEHDFQDFSRGPLINEKSQHAGNIPKSEGGEKPVPGAPTGRPDPIAENLTPPDTIPEELIAENAALRAELEAAKEAKAKEEEQARLASQTGPRHGKHVKAIGGAALVVLGTVGAVVGFKATQDNGEANTPPAPSETSVTQTTQETADQSGISGNNITITTPIESSATPSSSQIETDQSTVQSTQTVEKYTGPSLSELLTLSENPTEFAKLPIETRLAFAAWAMNPQNGKVNLDHVKVNDDAKPYHIENTNPSESDDIQKISNGVSYIAGVVDGEGFTSIKNNENGFSIVINAGLATSVLSAYLDTNDQLLSQNVNDTYTMLEAANNSGQFIYNTDYFKATGNPTHSTTDIDGKTVPTITDTGLASPTTNQSGEIQTSETSRTYALITFMGLDGNEHKQWVLTNITPLQN